MVFPSFPLFLDHSNIHQLQQSLYPNPGTGLENPHIPTPHPPPPAASVGGGPGSIRPGSMVDRARLAQIPLQENGLRCPRCDSTKTKFCYFNNYNLTQPRHFCKACRRYWTRGGALRNVPVGGGCRRNKKSKGSKSCGGSMEKQSGGSTSTDACRTNCGSTEIIGNFSGQLPLTDSFQASLINHYGSSIGGFHQPPQLVTAARNENRGFGGEMSFQLGSNNNNNSFLSAGGEPWRLPASLAGFEPPPSINLFPNFENEGIIASPSRGVPNDHHDQLTSSVKNEESKGQNGNSTKQFLGDLGNNPYWGGGSGSSWTGGFSGQFNSSSASSAGHLL